MSAAVKRRAAAQPDSRLAPRRRVERARFSDLRQLLRLLGNAVPDCAPQTVWQLPWMWPQYSVARVAGEIVACGALCPLENEPQRVEVRGVYVAPAHRGDGHAGAIVEALLARAPQSVEVVCITRQPGFFARHGFVPIAWPAWLEHGRRASRGAPRTAMCRDTRAAAEARARRADAHGAQR